MKIRTIIITAVLTLSMAAGMAGCAGGNSSVSDTSSVSQVSQENGSGYSDDNDTKVLQMLDKVTLNGKPVVLPFKLSDLGEGYSFDKNDVSVYEKDGNTYAYTDLLYNNKMITTVSLFEYAEGQKTEDFIVDMISYSYLDNESVSEIIKVDDISGKNKKEDVLSKFGEPTNRETLDTGSEIITYETNNNDNSYVEFWFTKDNIISTIMIKNI